MIQPDALDHRPLMAAANDEIDRLHGSLDLPDSEFFCECGIPAAPNGAESRPVLIAAHANGASSALTTQAGSERRGH